MICTKSFSFCFQSHFSCVVTLPKEQTAQACGYPKNAIPAMIASREVRGCLGGRLGPFLLYQK